MPKQGEIDYLKNIGAEGALHAAHKPFSDPACGTYLAGIGTVMALLPPAPASVLDLGCGTGWTSCFLAKNGYDVTGQDICPDMIEEARRNQARYQIATIEFVTSDYDDLTYRGRFDAAVFFDSLHHSTDETAALAMVFRALKPGGACVTSEPGDGHEVNPHTMEPVRRFNVTERDMPPSRIIAAAKRAGFSGFAVYPHPQALFAAYYQARGVGFARRRLRQLRLAMAPRFGIVVLRKAAASGAIRAASQAASGRAA